MYMKRLLTLTIILISALILLSGCVSVDYQITINSDGTGKISYIYTFDKTFLNSTSSNTTDNSASSSQSIIDNMKTTAEGNGFTVEDYSDSSVQGIKATKDVNDVTSDLALSNLFGNNIQDSPDNNIHITSGAFSISYSQDASFDLTSMKSISPQNASLKYSVTLPVKAETNNADEVSNDGKTLTWNLKPGTVTKVKFEAKGNILTTKNIPVISNIVHNQGNNIYINILNWVILGLIILAVFVLIFFIVKKIKHKKTSKH